MIGLIDYRMGNLRSVEKALQRFDAPVSIVRTPAELSHCDKLILPGVGAFADAMIHLRQQQLVEPLRDFAASGKPFLGICLGLQLLFDTSTEDGSHEGLGILPGGVVRFDPIDPTVKVPQMGWNALSFTQRDNPLFAGLADGCFVYFVHSYFAQPADAATTAATADYAGPFCAAVRKANIFATQFHPEKSQRVGLKMLENFARL
ncbi:MAG: imidazole glycerol phosphate synthase subunit HisH [Phycisphaeraceae bacterium]